ncbi:MAG: GGDEF domain-containing protein [Armatimonadota bacterium]
MMGGESLAILIVEPGRARVCRFNVELRGETLWTTTTEELARRLGTTRPEIVAVAGTMEVATKLADELRRRQIAESVFLITPAEDGDPTPTGQIRVSLPQHVKVMKPELLVERLIRAVLSAQARTPVSPLTGLPGSPVLRNSVEQRLASAGQFVFLYLDIDNFKAFNDVYGFARGDIAIRLLGQEVVEAVRSLGTPSDLCVHIGGDDFAIVTGREQAGAIAQRVIEGFDRKAPDLYSPEARQAGYIETQSRRGEPERYPLMTVSIGGVDTGRRRVTSYLELAAIAAEVKGYAKALEGSRFVLDRRRE